MLLRKLVSTKENRSKNEHFKLSQNVKYKNLKGLHNNIEDNLDNVSHKTHF